MNTIVALLRAVNVGGTGLLRMQDLAALCSDIGFADVRTYIQSGNVVFRSARGLEPARVSLERALAAHMGKPIDVLVRDASELRRILDGNPFPRAERSTVAVLFYSQAVPQGLAKAVVAPGGEEVVAGKREIYIHYPNGMGRSKLKLPKMEGVATARNLNTVAKLVTMAETPSGAGPDQRRASEGEPTRKARPGRRRARA